MDRVGRTVCRRFFISSERQIPLIHAKILKRQITQVRVARRRNLRAGRGVPPAICNPHTRSFNLSPKFKGVHNIIGRDPNHPSAPKLG